MSEKKRVRGRMVKVTIWTDDKFPFLSDDAQSVWFHLYTNPMTTGLGIYQASVEGLAAARRWDLERYRKGFEEGLGEGMFCHDERYQIIYFPRFLKHNKPDNPNVLKSLLSCWEYLPSSVYKKHLKASICALGESYAKVMRTFDDTLPETFEETLPPYVPLNLPRNSNSNSNRDRDSSFPLSAEGRMCSSNGMGFDGGEEF